MTIPLTVTDVKQYTYCPRIIYFTYIMPVGKMPTHNMLIGKNQHIIVETLEKRRTLRRYQLENAERRFRVRCASTYLNLSGVLDMVLQQGITISPVEFKNSSGAPQVHHKLQLAAYGVILEETTGCQVERGFLYTLADNKVVSIAIDSKLKERVRRTCTEIRRLIHDETMPLATRDKRKCYDCEWRRYCADLY